MTKGELKARLLNNREAIRAANSARQVLAFTRTGDMRVVKSCNVFPPASDDLEEWGDVQFVLGVFADARTRASETKVLWGTETRR